MDKELFEGIKEGLQEALAYASGEAVQGIRVHVPEHIDVSAVRHKVGMTQQDFAITFGFSLSGLKKWERGERTPEGSARVLLHMIEKDASAVLHLAS